jgi:hypothetical protein
VADDHDIAGRSGRVADDGEKRFRICVIKGIGVVDGRVGFPERERKIESFACAACGGADDMVGDKAVFGDVSSHSWSGFLPARA